MWSLTVFLCLLIISVWLGIEIVQHPGYLLLVYKPWMVQMPFWFALLSLIVLFFLFYLLIDSIDRFQFMWFRLKNWLQFRREHQFYSKTQQGLSALIEARWKKSEKLLIAGVNQTGEPLMNYLGAAKAAHEQQAYDRRDAYIQTAYKIAPNADLAIGITQAELELEQNKFEQAAATLNHLKQVAPRHPRVLKLLEKVYIHLGDWKGLRAIIPNMYKAKLITAEETELFEKNIYCEMFRSATNKSLSEIKEMWDNVPRVQAKNPDVVYEYIKQLQRFELISNNEISKEIEDLIRKTIKNTYHPELVKLYGSLPFDNLNRQLVIVGGWLKLYGSRPEILLTLGKLCTRVQLWGKAKDYFEKCLSLGPNPEASFAYGKLLERLGESESALQKYREGLAELSAST